MYTLGNKLRYGVGHTLRTTDCSTFTAHDREVSTELLALSGPRQQLRRGAPKSPACDKNRCPKVPSPSGRRVWLKLGSRWQELWPAEVVGATAQPSQEAIDAAVHVMQNAILDALQERSRQLRVLSVGTMQGSAYWQSTPRPDSLPVLRYQLPTVVRILIISTVQCG
jgi:hypothetical protein